jgi:hypothetical protein
MMRVKIEGLEQLQSAVLAVVAAAEAGAAEGEADAAGLIAEEWRRDAPVDTGEYRDSIDVRGGDVFATAAHAAFVWFGTWSHVAQPSDSAIERGRSEAPRIIGDRIKRRLP